MAKHYVVTDQQGRVLRGFSTDFEQPNAGNICISENGGRHFELNGVINPTIVNEHGIALYKIVDGKVEARTEGEINTEKVEVVPAATLEERTSALEIAVRELAANGAGTAELEAALAEIEAALNG